MKRLFLIALICLTSTAYAQEFGLSFSYFLPKNGYFSTPISPFSIRGLGVDFNRFVAFETGASLYRMSGLNLKDLPFESKEPLVGPNFTIFVPAEIVFMLKGNSVELDVKGGGFFFYGFGNKINYGNFDRALRDYHNLDVANATISFDNKPGFGYHVGTELTFYITQQIGFAIETNYLVGQAKFPLSGSYVGGSNGTLNAAEPINYTDAKIDFTGLEFSFSILYNAGGGGPAPKRPKRRR